MEFVNATRMAAGFNIGMERDGREVLVVVVKGTFVMPKSGEGVRLHAVQSPLCVADTFTGEPGLSAPVHEVDFAVRKRRCDVLLLGSAYAPQGRPAVRVPVEMRIGDWSKSFAVIGARHWSSGLTGWRLTDAKPFARLPITYDVAYGGVDSRVDVTSGLAPACASNPVGRGFRKDESSAPSEGLALPSTEELQRPIDASVRDYVPMSFGPIGRGWQPRASFGGSYDSHWLENVFPFLPADFDERYWQAAPPDQQIALTPGDLQVSLANLTPDGRRAFRLPSYEAPILVVPKSGPREHCRAVLDTIVFQPDDEMFAMVWRYSRPLRRDVFDISQVTVGRTAVTVPSIFLGETALLPEAAFHAASPAATVAHVR